MITRHKYGNSCPKCNDIETIWPPNAWMNGILTRDLQLDRPMPQPAAQWPSPGNVLRQWLKYYQHYSLTYPRGTEGWVGLSTMSVNNLLKLKKKTYSESYGRILMRCFEKEQSATCLWVWMPALMHSSRHGATAASILSSVPIICTASWSDSIPIALNTIITGRSYTSNKSQCLSSRANSRLNS